MAISDKQFEAIERLGNCAIHEIVFALHHAEDDQQLEAAESLMTAQQNLEQIAAALAETTSGPAHVRD
jgi:hypothetical protein